MIEQLKAARDRYEKFRLLVARTTKTTDVEGLQQAIIDLAIMYDRESEIASQLLGELNSTKQDAVRRERVVSEN